MSPPRKISTTELSEHNKADDAWILLNGSIWDITSFAPTHPGGAEIIHEYIGHDGSAAYNEVHGPSLVSKHLSPSCKIGEIDETTMTKEWRARQAANVESLPQTRDGEERPPLEGILNMYDFERVAQRFLTPKAWAFQTAAANDGITKGANGEFWRRIWFRPRVLAGVRDVDTSCVVLGQRYSVPLFSAPASLARLGHPEGERAMARALVGRGTTLIACNMASFSFAEICEVIPDGYPLFWQLYVNKNRGVTEALVREVSQRKGLQGIMVTADLPVVGKREDDERVKHEATFKQPKSFQGDKGGKLDKKGSGLARATGSFIDPDLKWEDIRWLRSLTKAPIFVKGIQCAEDAKRALEAGCAGIYISNHGGRACDTAQPSLLTLMEINRTCPEVLAKMEVFVDGGIRRGTDVLKAICLGASAVTMGRPFLFAVGYGQEGVEHAIDIIKDELETAMQMVGITRLDQAHPGLLNTADLDHMVYSGDGHPWAKKIVRDTTTRARL